MCRRLAASCARRLGDPVDAAAFLCGRSQGEPELLLQASRKDAAHGMTLPARHARHLVNRGALGLTQHGNHRVLLRGALRLAAPDRAAFRSPTFRLLSTPGSAFHNASSRLPLSGAACSSSFDVTTISPSLTLAGVLRQSTMPSLPMMKVRMG